MTTARDEAFPRNDIEAGLVAAHRGEVPVEEWLRRLATATVQVPVRPSADAAAATSLPVLSIAGRSYVPVFTSSGEAREATSGAALVPRVLADLIGVLPGGVGISINPGRPLSLAVPPDDLRRIVTGRTAIPVGARLRVGDPAEEPVEALRSILGSLAGLDAVREVRRAWVMVDDDPPSLAIGVDLDPDAPATRERVVRAVAAAAADVRGAVDVVFSNDGGPVVDWMWRSSSPLDAAEL